MDTAENRLRVMPDYNLSRGTLRLFARMVRDLWDDPSRDPELITAGDIDWSSTCTLYLGSFQPFLCRTVGGVVGRITSLYLVPTLYHDLVGHPDFAACDTSSVTKLGFAGAAMPDGLLKRVDAAFRPALFVNHYGSSEIYTFTTEPRAAAKPGSAVKAGLNQRIRVVKIGTDNPGARAATGEEGQIIADRASDEAFEGYWRRPDADARALHDGWYFTGDTGYFDAEGDLFVTGRVDDMIISGGENVSPADIESVLSLHPAVAEVAVVGLPDERWGQRVTAFVKRAPNADVAVEPAALDAWCRASSLADYKRPRDYVFVAEIPKSPVGKILRRLLAAREYRRE